MTEGRIKKEKIQKTTLMELLIKQVCKDAYRAGTLQKKRKLIVGSEVIQKVGGRKSLEEQINFLRTQTDLERTGQLIFKMKDVNTDVEWIACKPSAIPCLCELVKKEDPRKHQLELIANLEKQRAQIEDCEWLCRYYDELLKKLNKGKIVTEAEDTLQFCCINAVARQREAIWEKVFSSRVFHDSKKFEKQYRAKICTILGHYSPYCEEEMSEDELLAAHEIHSYKQTLEWKGPLTYQIDNEVIVDSSLNQYGTVLNTQTLEHAVPYTLTGCNRIMTIENKANYESMVYQKDTLYIFCHGYFTPKEVRFLKHLREISTKNCEFYHWGDMDYGGICIFQFIKDKVFPEIKPYRMNTVEYWHAIDLGAGLELKEETRTKLEKKNAGELEELKQCILKEGKTIEQELLL